jgi:hypothetical protein
MSEDVTVKITSRTQKHFQSIAKILETQFNIFSSTRSIFDKNTDTFHIYFSCEEK